MNKIVSIRYMIPLMLLLSVVLTSVMSEQYLSPRAKAAVEEEIVDDIKQIMSLLKNSTEVFIHQGNVDAIAGQLELLQDDKNVKLAVLASESGNILISGSRVLNGKSVNQGWSSFDYVNTIKEITDKNREIIRRFNKNISAIYAIGSLQEKGHEYYLIVEKNIESKLLQSQKKLTYEVVSFAGTALLLSIGLILLFHYMITRPIQYLSNLSMSLLADSDSTDFNKNKKSEFSRIEYTLRKMADELENYNHDNGKDGIISDKNRSLTSFGRWTLDVNSFEICSVDNVGFISALDSKVKDLDGFINIVHPDDRQMVRENIDNCINRARRFGIKHRIIKPDGQIRWVQETGDLVCDENNKARYMPVIVQDISEQMLLETHMLNTLRELNFQKYSMDLHAIIATTDTSGVITDVNDKFVEISGYSRQELIGQTHRIVNSGYHSDEFFADLWETISSGKPWEGDICNKNKKGELYWVHTTITPHLDDQGKPDSYTSIRTEITELKQMVEQLDLQASALESVSDGIVITDSNGYIKWVNHAYTRMTGFDYNEVVGRKPEIANFADTNGGHYNKVWDSLLSSEAWCAELWNKRKDGSIYLEEERITPVRNKDQKITYFVSVKRDITDRKKIENELSQFKETLDETLDCVFIFDPQTLLFTYANQGAMNQVGYSSDELMKLRPFDIKPEINEQQFRDRIRPLIEGEKQSITFDTVHMHKDGHKIPVEVFLQYIVPENDSPRFVAIVRDITTRQQLQRQLQQAQKMEAVGQLTGGIAHDFNNILASVLGYAELAREELKQYDNNQIESFLNEIYNSGIRAKDLVEQMLAFSRGSNKMYKLQSVSKLVNESLKMLGSILPSSIEIDCQIPDEEFFINTDPVQIHQLVMNLCINARDAMEGQGKIGIHLSRLDDAVFECNGCHEKLRGNYIRLLISDTGCGIDAEHIQRIFDPFYTTKEAGHGSGMGLSMVHRIMHDHSGHVIVDSEINKGTRFSLMFPALEYCQYDDSISEKNSEISEDSLASHESKILIVDDEMSVGKFIGEVFNQQGYQTIIETSSEKAFSMLNQNPDAFDLLVTDQTMPGMTGMELAQSIKDIRPDLPVILCSGYNDDIVEEKANLTGVSAFISKPIDTRKILSTTRKLLSNRDYVSPNVS